MQQFVAGVFALVSLGMIFGGLPGLALNRTAVSLPGRAFRGGRGQSPLIALGRCFQYKAHRNAPCCANGGI